MHASLPSGSASTQNAGAARSESSVPPAASAASTRAPASSAGTSTSMCMRLRCGQARPSAETKFGSAAGRVDRRRRQLGPDSSAYPVIAFQNGRTAGMSSASMAISTPARRPASCAVPAPLAPPTPVRESDVAPQSPSRPPLTATAARPGPRGCPRSSDPARRRPPLKRQATPPPSPPSRTVPTLLFGWRPAGGASPEGRLRPRTADAWVSRGRPRSPAYRRPGLQFARLDRLAGVLRSRDLTRGETDPERGDADDHRDPGDPQ